MSIPHIEEFCDGCGLMKNRLKECVFCSFIKEYRLNMELIRSEITFLKKDLQQMRFAGFAEDDYLTKTRCNHPSRDTMGKCILCGDVT